MANNYFYITSKLSNDLVLDIQGGSTVDVTPLVSDTRQTGVDSQMWVQTYTGDPDPGGRYVNFFIENKLTNAGQTLVADVEGNNNTPGTRVISYHKKVPDGDNQVWQLISSASHSGYFYITSNLAAPAGDQPLVMTVENASTTPGAQVISTPKTSCSSKKSAFASTSKKSAFAGGECDNQLWSLVPVPDKKSAFAPKKSAFATT